MIEYVVNEFYDAYVDYAFGYLFYYVQNLILIVRRQFSSPRKSFRVSFLINFRCPEIRSNGKKRISLPVFYAFSSDRAGTSNLFLELFCKFGKKAPEFPRFYGVRTTVTLSSGQLVIALREPFRLLKCFPCLSLCICLSRIEINREFLQPVFLSFHAFLRWSLP